VRRAPLRQMRVPVRQSGVTLAATIALGGCGGGAEATLGGTVYVVGGYIGSRPLATIVAWTGSSTARVVARLPHPLSSAAVAGADGRLIIAGGTGRRGATRPGYSFEPARRRSSRIATLPRPVTRA